jgi:hypothetical protein
LIAQEVEQAILDIGMTTEDFAALCYDAETDRYAVRYTELIPVLIRGWHKTNRQGSKSLKQDW